MRILAIETSCDETAIAIVDAEVNGASGRFRVRGSALLSQIDVHQKYGGVFPALAKREHAKNLVPLLKAALEEAGLLHEEVRKMPEDTRAAIAAMLAREPGLAEPFLAFISECAPPAIDALAVTVGPGLEPALWVGINFAEALACAWEKPLVAINHLEGHILAALALPQPDLNPHSQGLTLEIQPVALPLLALLISGGHTELVLMREWLRYERIGGTRDDAVGEAFDKVARMLGLPYPGGPEISRLAEEVRTSDVQASELGHRMSKFALPRPMLHEDSCDFSFAGLKTAVLYLLKRLPLPSGDDKKYIAREFEDAAADVLWAKTARALRQTGARTLAVGGGVSANRHIQRTFREKMAHEFPDTELRLPRADLATDNAIMVALAGAYRVARGDFPVRGRTDIRADGNLSLVI